MSMFVYNPDFLLSGDVNLVYAFVALAL